MSPEPGANELRYRRRLIWQHLCRGQLLDALFAALSAWYFHRFLKSRRSS